MPYYGVTLHYFDGTVLSGVRQHNSYDIDFVYRYFIEQVKNGVKGKPVDSVEVVMVPKTADDVKKYISRHVKGK